MARLHHRRFVVSPDAIRVGEVDLSAHARQLVTVLRLRRGDEITILDGSGREWQAVLTAADARQARADLVCELPSAADLERCPAITLVQVVPRGSAMDTILAKTTELGVTRIVPIEAAHSVRRLGDRRPRWERIVREAAEQSGRRTVPEIADACTIQGYIAQRGSGQLMVCDADPAAAPVLAACRDVAAEKAVACVVGAEGGLSSDELAHLRDAGGTPITLGPHLLRADTAAIAAVGLLRAGCAYWQSTTFVNE